MARTLTKAAIQLDISTIVRNDLTIANRAATSPVKFSLNQPVSNGRGIGQADRATEYETTIASGDTLIINLYDWIGTDVGGGDGNDAVGQPMDLAEVVCIAIANENAVGTAGSLEVEPYTSEGWTPLGEHTVANGGALKGQGSLVKINMASPAFPVEDGVSQNIALTAVGGNIAVRITVFGRSVDPASSSSSSSGL
jgi:hypothetical protein